MYQNIIYLRDNLKSNFTSKKKMKTIIYNNINEIAKRLLNKISWIKCNVILVIK